MPAPYIGGHDHGYANDTLASVKDPQNLQTTFAFQVYFPQLSSCTIDLPRDWINLPSTFDVTETLRS
jgi:hypothetical protein